jgi:hypothetical protein
MTDEPTKPLRDRIKLGPNCREALEFPSDWVRANPGVTIALIGVGGVGPIKPAPESEERPRTAPKDDSRGSKNT